MTIKFGLGMKKFLWVLVFFVSINCFGEDPKSKAKAKKSTLFIEGETEEAVIDSKLLRVFQGLFYGPNNDLFTGYALMRFPLGKPQLRLKYLKGKIIESVSFNWKGERTSLSKTIKTDPIGGFDYIENYFPGMKKKWVVNLVEGEFTDYYRDGMVKTKIPMSIGKTPKDGEITEHYENGKIKKSYFLKGGILEGIWKVFNEKGDLIQEREFKNGVYFENVKPFSGNKLIRTATGEPLYFTQFKEGRYHGLNGEWNPAGRLIFLHEYVNGVTNGENLADFLEPSEKIDFDDPPDGARLKGVFQQKNLNKKVDSLGLSRWRPNKKLYQKFWDQLDYKSLEAEAALAFDGDFINEWRIAGWTGLFKGKKLEEVEPFFEAWKKDFPKSNWPFLARGNWLITEAWEERGNRWAGDTTPNQMGGYVGYLKKAKEELLTLLAKDPDFYLTYEPLMTLSMGLSERDELEKYFKMGHKLAPLSQSIYNVFMYANTPRWGGSYEIMEEISTLAEEFSDQNPVLKIFKYSIIMDQISLFPNLSDYRRRLSHYTIKKGKILKQIVDEFPYSNYEMDLAENYLQRSRLDLALKYFSRVIEQCPDNSPRSHLNRAAIVYNQATDLPIYLQRGSLARAKRDVIESLKQDKSNIKAKNLLVSVEKKLAILDPSQFELK